MTAITIKEYYAERGSLFSNKDAEKIGPVLHALSEQGGVTPRDVLDTARSDNSPLHEYFEWNDKKAADEYRLEQARRMLRSINVRYIEDGQPKEARAFQVVHKQAYEGGPRQYKSFQVLYGDSAFAAQMMDRAFEDLVTWKKRYQPYTEMWANFGDCFQAVINQISEFSDEFKLEHAASETDEALAKLLAWREECRAVLESWTAAREQVAFIMDAIGEAEALFGKLNKARERNCMTCQKPFLSLSTGNRMCPKCSAIGSGMDEAVIGAA